ncbi:hypothetical protein ACFX19_017119 [Malus domestica]
MNLLAQHQAMEEVARKARERGFDVGLIERGGVVAPGTENVELFDFVEPDGGMVRDEERGIWVYRWI